VLSRPPGYSVEPYTSSITLSGVIAARLGGWVAATNNWVMPG